MLLTSQSMRSRSSRLRPRRTVKDRELRILFLGLDNSGKSTILKKVLGESTDDVSPTLGFDIRTLIHRG